MERKVKYPISEEIDVPDGKVLLKMYEDAKIKPLKIENLQVGTKGPLNLEDLKNIFQKIFYGE